MIKTCSIDGCDKPLRARGWCAAHWYRWRHHGHPLAGGPPHGEVRKFYHEQVLRYEGDDCLFWPFARNNAGYAQIGANRKTVLVSRLVCEVENGPPPTPEHEAAHSCDNGHLGCVSRKHLRWKTHAENQAEMSTRGNSLRGERAASSKLTAADAIQILLAKGKEPQSQIARRFGVSRSLVSAIHIRRVWGWLDVKI